MRILTILEFDVNVIGMMIRETFNFGRGKDIEEGMIFLGNCLAYLFLQIESFTRQFYVRGDQW
jgi:deferrochelatase/peroxidase EfeB